MPGAHNNFLLSHPWLADAPAFTLSNIRHFTIQWESADNGLIQSLPNVNSLL